MSQHLQDLNQTTLDIPPASRKIPPLVGIQLHAKQLSSTQANAARYDSSIMHRIVPPTLEQVTVLIDASACDIAATFSLPLAFVTSHWLTSRSPMELPGYKNSILHQNNLSSNQQSSSTLSATQLNSYRDFAIALTTKLAIYADQQQQQQKQSIHTKSNHHLTRPSRATIEKIYQRAIRNNQLNYQTQFSSTSLSSTPTTTTTTSKQKKQIKQRPLLRNCAFSSSLTHTDLQLSEDHRTVTKPKDGLYRRSLTTTSLDLSSVYYSEFVVRCNQGQGGLCFGIASSNNPLSKLPIGAYPNEISYHSSGQLIFSNGQWKDYGKSYQIDDTIGILVEMPNLPRLSDISSTEINTSPISSSTTNNTSQNKLDSQDDQLSAKVTFFVNGDNQGPVFLNYHYQPDVSLHMAACLYRKGCSVEIHCCGSDWQYFPSAQAAYANFRPICRPSSNSNTMVNNKLSQNSSSKGLIKTASNEGDCRDCTSDLTP